MENLEESEQIEKEENLPPQPSPKRKYLLIGIITTLVVLIGGVGILLLQGMTTPSVSEGKTLIYGKAVALSDVQTIPDGPLTVGTIGAISEERFDSFVGEVRQADTAFLSQSIISSYVVASSSFDGRGAFQFELDPGFYILCYFSYFISPETKRLEACARTLTLKQEKNSQLRSRRCLEQLSQEGD
ncbi:hypothetical protein IID24_05140 [Patescibacteria group bacterium]|nr:hypothetical protein [Patescibacteria group bacterium]